MLPRTRLDKQRKRKNAELERAQAPYPRFSLRSSLKVRTTSIQLDSFARPDSRFQNPQPQKQRKKKAASWELEEMEFESSNSYVLSLSCQRNSMHSGKYLPSSDSHNAIGGHDWARRRRQAVVDEAEKSTMDDNLGFMKVQ